MKYLNLTMMLNLKSLRIILVAAVIFMSLINVIVCKNVYDVTGLCSRARSDGQDVIFAKIEETMITSEYTTLEAQIAVLKEVAEEYPGKTIENIIAQMEARRKEG